MSDSFDHGDPPPDDELPEPLHGHVRHSNLSARVTPDVAEGVFSNGAIVLNGPYECVLDFVIRLAEIQRVVARVVLPAPVGQQFAQALQENIHLYESRFGPVEGQSPRPRGSEPPAGEVSPGEPGAPAGAGAISPLAGGGSSEGAREGQDPPPSIDVIYDELKLPDELLCGRYSNAVLIRHSSTEFCFDFISNVYPRSAVAARIFMAAGQVQPLLRSLRQALSDPPGNDPPPPMDPSSN
ncbi:hypothetical protein Mal4_36480 [Maioricimonas rarisocia]|uniref:DUF3467 domain-containing protein n=1 Tax=Maioricimonas rarisocia TaxID=2528026 RepID=A0A517ZA77_9PLAN|nr:DUF3467 domain-containing protein [Maioricimonas rarisocia]QDU39309.1 hypothetical protein Mal4_36480 [Maioricimonas rarisocia]